MLVNAKDFLNYLLFHRYIGEGYNFDSIIQGFNNHLEQKREQKIAETSIKDNHPVTGDYQPMEAKDLVNILRQGQLNPLTAQQLARIR